MNGKCRLKTARPAFLRRRATAVRRNKKVQAAVFTVKWRIILQRRQFRRFLIRTLYGFSF
ncbi:hypothetical protein NEIPOLOT_00931 [Neisseria polysaccharea ATCC 43768]|uniref:hypothetical protein n=1 Tax=Neisseria polysaccharea TaxID=489 RepID=UPI0001D9D7BA|nr:hypothetical protein [Neisseria polysaccharea]EFH23239.1 hypothetical protein NEIPOLOT_00931 [Neisseria polysaccharea ATCC 43768]